jgi:lantibiotic modifying enzyme
MPAPPQLPARRDESYLSIAREAARWLRASAVPTAHGVAWPAAPPDRSTIQANLYSGSAGVVLFFLTLHRATGDAAHLAIAAAGAGELLAAIERDPEPGFYDGLAGIGFVLGEAGLATGDARYAAGARRVVDLLEARAIATSDGGAEWNDTTDVIGGSAGIGLFLLHAADRIPLPEARSLAMRAGRGLLTRALPAAGGLTWPMDGTSAHRFPNFAHGTAGVAYFLATLHASSGDRACLDGALAGARYLQAIARTDAGTCLIAHHEPDAEGQHLFYLGWCHGPAGTARLWYRLWQVTSDDAWLAWSSRSARAILASGVPERQTPGFWNNVGQCCGSAGIGEFFLARHRDGDPEALPFARRLASRALAAATRDDAGARWAHAEHRTRPMELTAQAGWMQGAAGIAAWLVHLDAAERGRPSPAIPFPDSPF